MDPTRGFQLASLDRVVRGVGMPEDIGPARAALTGGLASLPALHRDATIRYLAGSQLGEDVVLGRSALGSILGRELRYYEP